MRVLIVDDDRELVDLLRHLFQRDGYDVTTAFDGETGLRAFESSAPDLVMLDQVMPGRTGLEVLKEIRRRSQVPVIMLTSLADEEHVVQALQAGADDYIVKPFRPRELRARAAAAIRHGVRRTEAPPRAPTPLSCGEIRLDPGQHVLTIGERPVHLTRTEFSLLHDLMLHANTVRSLPDIISDVWGREMIENEDVVKVHISRLRRKIERNPAQPEYLLTITGAGYMFRCPA